MIIEKHKQIRNLPEVNQKAVEQMLRRGDSCDQVARLIHDDWHMLLDVSFEALKQALLRFRKDRIGNAIVEGLMDSGMVNRLTLLAQKVDVIEELSQLYWAQKQRIAILHMHEEGLPNNMLKLQLELKKEIAVAESLLKTLGHLQLETGIMRRAPKTMVATPPQPGGDGSWTFRVNEEAVKIIEGFREKQKKYVEHQPA